MDFENGRTVLGEIAKGLKEISALLSDDGSEKEKTRFLRGRLTRQLPVL
jgi:hypothetical protein